MPSIGDAGADPPQLDAWLRAAEQRYLAELTFAEVTRALRALSSCYVERRGKLADGSALDGAGKRAAFALFYAPLHALITHRVARALPAPLAPGTRLLDLGCGTGAASAAWALAAASSIEIEGFDRSAWAVSEAPWTWRACGVRGRATRTDVARLRLPRGPHACLAAFTINELPAETRHAVRGRLLAAAHDGHPVLDHRAARRRRGAVVDRVGGCVPAGRSTRGRVALPRATPRHRRTLRPRGRPAASRADRANDLRGATDRMTRGLVVFAMVAASAGILTAAAQAPNDGGTLGVTCRVRGDARNREFRLSEAAGKSAAATDASRWQLSMRDAESRDAWINLRLPGARPAMTANTAALSYRNANGGRHVDLEVSSSGSRLEVWVDYGLEVNVEPDLDPHVDRLNTDGPLTAIDCAIDRGKE